MDRSKLYLESWSATSTHLKITRKGLLDACQYVGIVILRKVLYVTMYMCMYMVTCLGNYHLLTWGTYLYVSISQVEAGKGLLYPPPIIDCQVFKALMAMQHACWAANYSFNERRKQSIAGLT